MSSAYTQFEATYELGRHLGRVEQNNRILELAYEASIDPSDFIHDSDQGRYVYLSDLKEYLEADIAKQSH